MASPDTAVYTNYRCLNPACDHEDLVVQQDHSRRDSWQIGTSPDSMSFSVVSPRPICPFCASYLHAVLDLSRVWNVSKLRIKA
jgi:hypothetical protein